MQVLTTAITDTLGTLSIRLRRSHGPGERDRGRLRVAPSWRISTAVVVPDRLRQASRQSTLANDGGNPFDFDVRKSIIYRGKATVTEGPSRSRS
jgi:hypothetical protein